jgi:hypothetical protein
MPHRDRNRPIITRLASGLLFCLPISIGLLAASLSGSGPPLWLIAPVSMIAIVVAIAWRARLATQAPEQQPPLDDEGFDWRRWDGDEDPPDPLNGPGGVVIDWRAFERDFWAHVGRLGRTPAPTL